MKTLLRRSTSLTLMCSLLMMAVTATILFVVPQGRVAYWADWRLLGLSKTQWGNLHTNLGFLGLLAGMLHLWFNWGAVMTYLKNKAREMRVATPAFSIAASLTVIMITGTLFEVPPLVWIQDLREVAEEAGVRTYGEPPYGHAEESSLRAFLRNIGLDPERAKANLAAAGIDVTDPEQPILDLAHDHGLTPRQLHEAMLGPEDQRPAGPRPLPEAVPMGTGRRTLAEFCSEYNRDVTRAVAVLAAAGLAAAPDQTLKEIAEAGEVETIDLLDALRAGLD